MELTPYSFVVIVVMASLVTLIVFLIWGSYLDRASYVDYLEKRVDFLESVMANHQSCEGDRRTPFVEDFLGMIEMTDES